MNSEESKKPIGKDFGFGLLVANAVLLIVAALGVYGYLDPDIGSRPAIWFGSALGSLLGAVMIGGIVYSLIYVCNPKRETTKNRKWLVVTVWIMLVLLALGKIGNEAHAAEASISNAEGKVFFEFVGSERKLAEKSVKEYQDWLNYAEWQSIFDVNRIRNDYNLADSVIILRESEEAANFFVDERTAHFATLRSRIENLRTTAKMKRLLASLYLDPELRHLENRTLEIEKEIVSEATQAFMSMYVDREWEIYGEEIRFKNAERQKRFNFHMSNIGKLTTEQSNLASKLKVIHQRIAANNRRILGME